MTELNKEALENLRLLAERATERVEHVVIEPDIFTELINKYPMTTITTLEELEELPVGSVVVSDLGDVFNKVPTTFWGEWICAGSSDDWKTKEIELPARVLYKGGK